MIEELGKFYFKVKAKAEEKKMEAEGLKEGEDFLKGEVLFSLVLSFLDWRSLPFFCASLFFCFLFYYYQFISPQSFILAHVDEVLSQLYII